MRYISPLGLQVYLIGLIIIIASLSLLTTAAYSLYQTNVESRHKLSVKAESIHKHIELQLLQIKSGYKHPKHFPDLRLISNKKHYQEGCINYTAVDRTILRNSCYGGANSSRTLPDWFKKLYHWVFHPKNELVKLITYNNQVYGKLILTPNANKEIDHAWNDIKKLISLFSVTLTSMSIMLYFFLGRALKPADHIVSSLEDMAQGNLSTRLPEFNMVEWQRTATAINQLSDNLEHSISERNKLTVKLMNVQEEERRFLTRELHDVFGQCLAGLQATAFSLSQIAKEKCHELVGGCQNILAINSLMMEHLRNMLQQLHPSNLDELGLAASLKSMVSNWNMQSDGKIKYTIELDNCTNQIPETVSSHIFRIVQESLTNIVKHSEARNAVVKLERTSSLNIGTDSHSVDTICLTIADDGVAKNITFNHLNGMGLIGMRERVTALEGKITLSNNIPCGLIVQVWLPVELIINSHN